MKNIGKASQSASEYVVETLFFCFFCFWENFCFPRFFAVRSSKKDKKHHESIRESSQDTLRMRAIRDNSNARTYPLVRAPKSKSSSLFGMRPTHTGCCERKKHETIHSIKAIYPQNFVFLALTTPLSEKYMGEILWVKSPG